MGEKRDSEEICLLKMVYLGEGRHPVRAVRSTQLTRHVVWADPLNSLLGPGRRGISRGRQHLNVVSIVVVRASHLHHEPYIRSAVAVICMKF